MRILSISNTADVYGASRCLERVFGLLARQGHEIHVVVPCGGPLVRKLQADGITVHVHRGLSILDRAEMRSAVGVLRFIAGFPLSVVFLISLILKYKYDVIHSNTGVLPAGGLAAKLTARPHVWHVRELLSEFPRQWNPYQRYMSATSDAIVAISMCTREQFEPAIQSKVQVVYDGLNEEIAFVEESRRQAFRAEFPLGRTLIGCVGRIKLHRKGQEVLVQAAALLKERFPEAFYVLVGTPAPGNEEHELKLREMVKALGVEDRVVFFGDSPEPITVFSALDIAVVPSVQTEPFGCVVIEAMAAGTPVIGSGSGGIAEQIVDGVSGLLFPPGDATALSAAIERLLVDLPFRKALAEGGWRRVREDFQLEATGRELLSIFNKVAGAKRSVAFRQESL